LHSLPTRRSSDLDRSGRRRRPDRAGEPLVGIRGYSGAGASSGSTTSVVAMMTKAVARRSVRFNAAIPRLAQPWQVTAWFGRKPALSLYQLYVDGRRSVPCTPGGSAKLTLA